MICPRLSCSMGLQAVESAVIIISNQPNIHFRSCLQNYNSGAGLESTTGELSIPNRENKHLQIHTKLSKPAWLQQGV